MGARPVLAPAPSRFSHAPPMALAQPSGCALSAPRRAATRHSICRPSATISGRFSTPVQPASTPARFSSPCSSTDAWLISETLAAVPSTRCTSPLASSEPMYAFIPKVPLVALFGLVHARSPLAPPVLARAGRGNGGRVNERAFAHEQFLFLQQHADFRENARARIMALDQVAELEQRRGVGHRFAAQVDARKVAQRLAVVERVLKRLVRQRIPLLEKVEPKHPLDPTGWRPRLPSG